MTGSVPLPDGTLRSLVYSSEAITRFYQDDLDRLLLQARAHNESVGITGILLYKNDQFIQFLEGPPDAVGELTERIRRDARHTNVRILIDEFTLERQFDDWTMGYQPLKHQSSTVLPGFRDSFADIADAPDALTTGRAAKELALWFRVRAGKPARAA
ncbi:BLUF domain-containing protein [Leucobacter sp. NPDC077196]|uniref:BLUF domain-containing protein n=1 Tax=Leucobacter sp. NPDC077196 TaxID=3154959 RepID=UPI0034442A40